MLVVGEGSVEAIHTVLFLLPSAGASPGSAVLRSLGPLQPGAVPGGDGRGAVPPACPHPC